MPLELDDTAAPTRPASTVATSDRSAPALDRTALARGGSSPALDRTSTLPGSARAPATAADAVGSLAPGRRIGHFRVERALGAGGMGEVYLATDLSLDRPVAIKVLPDATARDATRRGRLIREARAQARVVHPNVGHIYYVGEDDGLLYVAMEYVPGETLAQRAATAPMPVDDAVAAIYGAALGLREAQRAGFLHRDVKPSNLMLDAHGVVKVLDFGLAASALADDGAADPVAAASGGVSQTSIVGTPLYMAPEQARGEPIDVRTDIYALGATLYHLVSGRPPFDARTAEELRDLHASAPRPKLPAMKRSAHSVAVGDLCTRMMAPRAADRFASYDELLVAIDALTASRTRPAGFVVRAVAATIDLVLVLVASLLLIAAQKLAVGGREATSNAVVMYVLWFADQLLSVRRWGRTAGKALFELEVVSLARGERPSWRQAWWRAVVQLGAPLALTLAATIVDAAGYETGVLSGIRDLAVLLVVVLLLVGALADPRRRAVWDRWSGTIVRYRRADTRKS